MGNATSGRNAAPPVLPRRSSFGSSDVRQAQSFQGRITAAILLTSIAVLFVGCMLFMVEQHRMDRVEQQKSTDRIAAMLAATSDQALVSGDVAHATRILNQMQFLDRITTADIYDPNGLRIASYRRTASAHNRDQDSNEPLIRSEATATRDGHVIGRVVLWSAAPAVALLLPHYLAMGGALFFAATALALFLGRWLASRITRPVASLSRAMDEVGASGDFARRVEPHADDEIGRLTERFNELLAALYANDQQLRGAMAELVKARDAAEAANVLKSQFLANMSHEIRTPLNGVLAMAQIMARGELAEGQRERLDVIRQSGEALLALLNDILDVSKIEAGKFELEDVEFDLEEIVGGVRAAFSPVAERKGLAFEVAVEPDACGYRSGDATRLRQILNNFVSNALKFTDSGHVRVRLGGAGPDGAEGVHVSVTDTGIGIPAEKLPLLFQKFTQLDASTTRRYGGTGLGLAICHELATLMGGRVWVESVVGEGSTFHASLPLGRVRAVDPAEAAPMIVTEADPAAAPLRVLAAEDNPTNQLVLSTVMEMFGVELSLVGDGCEAVEAWERGAFDAILMDIQMPRMDGIAATRTIRAAEAETGRARTPIIALSANALLHQVQEYLAAGMDAHVAKPIELEKLQAALEDVLTAAAEAKAA